MTANYIVPQLVFSSILMIAWVIVDKMADQHLNPVLYWLAFQGIFLRLQVGSKITYALMFSIYIGLIYTTFASSVPIESEVSKGLKESFLLQASIEELFRVFLTVILCRGYLQRKKINQFLSFFTLSILTIGGSLYLFNQFGVYPAIGTLFVVMTHIFLKPKLSLIATLVFAGLISAFAFVNPAIYFTSNQYEISRVVIIVISALPLFFRLRLRE